MISCIYAEVFLELEFQTVTGRGQMRATAIRAFWSFWKCAGARTVCRVIARTTAQWARKNVCGQIDIQKTFLNRFEIFFLEKKFFLEEYRSSRNTWIQSEIPRINEATIEKSFLVAKQLFKNFLNLL